MVMEKPRQYISIPMVLIKSSHNINQVAILNKFRHMWLLGIVLKVKLKHKTMAQKLLNLCILMVQLKPYTNILMVVIEQKPNINIKALLVLIVILVFKILVLMIIPVFKILVQMLLLLQVIVVIIVIVFPPVM